MKNSGKLLGTLRNPKQPFMGPLLLFSLERFDDPLVDHILGRGLGFALAKHFKNPKTPLENSIKHAKLVISAPRSNNFLEANRQFLWTDGLTYGQSNLERSL